MELLARELGVSYSWFRHTFAAHTGLSPHQYLLEFRLVRARSLLTETEFSVKEIATQTGFEDEFYFSRLFRQKLNLTPASGAAAAVVMPDGNGFSLVKKSISYAIFVHCLKQRQCAKLFAYATITSTIAE